MRTIQSLALSLALVLSPAVMPTSHAHTQPSIMDGIGQVLAPVTLRAQDFIYYGDPGMECSGVEDFIVNGYGGQIISESYLGDYAYGGWPVLELVVCVYGFCGVVFVCHG